MQETDLVPVAAQKVHQTLVNQGKMDTDCKISVSYI